MILFVNKKNDYIGYSHNKDLCDGQIKYDKTTDKFSVVKISSTDNENGSYGKRVQQWLWGLKDRLGEKPHLICTG